MGEMQLSLILVPHLMCLKSVFKLSCPKRWGGGGGFNPLNTLPPRSVPASFPGWTKVTSKFDAKEGGRSVRLWLYIGC